jgi:hypothetical protein
MTRGRWNPSAAPPRPGTARLAGSASPAGTHRPAGPTSPSGADRPTGHAPATRTGITVAQRAGADAVLTQAGWYADPYGSGG